MLNKKATRIISLIIAIAILITMVASGIISIANSFVAGAASVSQLQSKLSGIESQKKELQSTLNNIKNQIENTTEKISVLKDQIALTQEDIETTQEIIEKLNGQIEQKEVEIIEAQEKLDKQTELFETRMRVMYENGNDIGYLDVILGSKSFSDMLSRMEIVTEIMHSDKKIVNDFKNAKIELEQAKQSLVNSKEKQKQYKASLEKKNSSLRSQKNEYEASKARLESDASKKDKEYDALEAEKAKINDEIAEISRKSAEEAARKAAQQAAASKRPSGSGGSSGSVGKPQSSNGSLSSVSVWPAPSYSKITSGFGYRNAPASGASSYHKGVDIGAPANSAVLASGSGTVVKSYYSSSYGNYIAIDHGGGVVTGYAHMNKRLVSVGQTVSAGDKIGLIGSTGISTGNHLHFEVYVDGKATNPMKYF